MFSIISAMIVEFIFSDNKKETAAGFGIMFEFLIVAIVVILVLGAIATGLEFIFDNAYLIFAVPALITIPMCISKMISEVRKWIKNIANFDYHKIPSVLNEYFFLLLIELFFIGGIGVFFGIIGWKYVNEKVFEYNKNVGYLPQKIIEARKVQAFKNACMSIYPFLITVIAFLICFCCITKYLESLPKKKLLEESQEDVVECPYCHRLRDRKALYCRYCNDSTWLPSTPEEFEEIDKILKEYGH